jgi:small subunit ribosomal protein S15
MNPDAIDIQPYQRHENDTGSPGVQAALLTKRIQHLTGHMGGHRKDFSSRRGLLMLVSKRRRLLDYLKRTDEPEYQKVIKGLGLRR